jgi:hypothetical protein
MPSGKSRLSVNGIVHEGVRAGFFVSIVRMSLPVKETTDR